MIHLGHKGFTKESARGATDEMVNGVRGGDARRNATLVLNSRLMWQGWDNAI